MLEIDDQENTKKFLMYIKLFFIFGSLLVCQIVTHDILLPNARSFFSEHHHGELLNKRRRLSDGLFMFTGNGYCRSHCSGSTSNCPLGALTEKEYCGGSREDCENRCVDWPQCVGYSYADETSIDIQNVCTNQKDSRCVIYYPRDDSYQCQIQELTTDREDYSCYCKLDGSLPGTETALNFQCTDQGCGWSNYVQGEDWDYYYKDTPAISCGVCKKECNLDANCGAVECGQNYCTWWKFGVCSVESSTESFNTCRKVGPPSYEYSGTCANLQCSENIYKESSGSDSGWDPLALIITIIFVISLGMCVFGGIGAFYLIWRENGIKGTFVILCTGVCDCCSCTDKKQDQMHFDSQNKETRKNQSGAHDLYGDNDRIVE